MERSASRKERLAPDASWTTLAQLLEVRASADGDATAYVQGSERLTYGALLDRAHGRAATFAAAGVGAGDRVVLALPAGIVFAEVFWGLQLLGAVPAAFSPTSSVEVRAQRERLVDTDRTFDESSLAALPPADPDRSPMPAASAIAPDDFAFIQPTSGTSGAPRAALVRHRNALAFSYATWQMGHVVREDVLIAWAPPWHDLGLVRFMIGAVYYGAACHIVQPAISTIPLWLRTIEEVGGTVSGAPDFAFRLANRMVPARSIDLSSLRYVTNGGEPARLSTITAFEEHFGLSGVCLPGYGLAEATLGVATHQPGDTVVADARGTVSNGLPLPGYEVRAGNGFDAPGEILVRSEAVFAGYLGAPQDTAARLQDGWLHTGDEGYFDAEGRLFILGRRAGMIKRGGAVVVPRALEEAAQEVEAVNVAAAVEVGLPGQPPAITVVVEVRDPADDADGVSSAVRRCVAARAGFAPDRVVVVAPRTIPRTENGKIRHAALRMALEAADVVGVG